MKKRRTFQINHDTDQALAHLLESESPVATPEDVDPEKTSKKSRQSSASKKKKKSDSVSEKQKRKEWMEDKVCFTTHIPRELYIALRVKAAREGIPVRHLVTSIFKDSGHFDEANL